MKTFRSMSPRVPRLIAAAAIAAAILGSGLYAGTAADAATPDVIHSCTTGSSSGNVNTCENIRNNGSTIEDAIASATVITSARTLLVCMTKPDGLQIGCDPSGWTLVKPGHTLSFEWAPDATEPTGSYCAFTWRQDADGSEPLIGKACVSFSAAATASTASDSTGTARASVSASPDFKSPEECGGDVCMVLTVNGSPAGAEITAGANNNAFTGYFHMSGPGGPFSPANSQTKFWHANGLGAGNDDFASQRLAPDHGTYCVSAFPEGGGASIGKACATY